MIDLPDLDAILVALRSPLAPDLHALIASRLEDAFACDLADLTHILVIQPGNTEAQIINAIGFSPLVSRMDGNRLQPDWDYIEPHPGWWELIYTVGDTGFAFLVFVERADGIIPELLKLCDAGASR
ncbi:hypothetical protein [Sphingopyxis fribergensis]